LPLFYQHTIDAATRLGIWKIEEDENFFLEKAPLQQNITHPHKRLQHLAGRYLLQFLFPDFPYSEILIADTRKPYLPGEQYHFSISHCGDYAAAIVSTSHRVGIDIEIPAEKVVRIAHKFVHENEKQLLQPSENCPELISSNDGENHALQKRLLTVLWSSKEALFKWYSWGKVDFRENMQLVQPIQQQDDKLLLPFVFQKEKTFYLNISAKIFKEIVLSWVFQ
jgi:4'-phosphopantetheinyl transferase EntD